MVERGGECAGNARGEQVVRAVVVTYSQRCQINVLVSLLFRGVSYLAYQCVAL